MKYLVLIILLSKPLAYVYSKTLEKDNVLIHSWFHAGTRRSAFIQCDYFNIATSEQWLILVKICIHLHQTQQNI